MSYATFVSALTGMSVTGVRRAYTSPPAQVSTADMPMLFPKLPEGSTEVDTLGNTTGIRRMTCDLVLAVEPITQNRQSANYAATLTLLDALETALIALAASDIRIDRWSVQMIDDLVGTSPCWCILATVEGSESS